MSTASFSTATTAAGRISTGPGVLLVAAPILMAVGRLLLVPLDDEDWDGVMSDMAANPGRSDAGWFLSIAACGLLAATAVILARRLADEGRGRTAMFVTVTTAMGWAAAAALSLTGLYLPIAADAADRATQVQLQDEFNDGSVGMLFMLTTLAAVGYVVAAVAFAQTRASSKPAATVLALGGAATLLTVSGPLTPLLVASAVLFAIGHGLLLRSPER